MESKFKVDGLIKICDEIYRIVKTTLAKSSVQFRISASSGKLPSFEQGDFVPVARDEYGSGEKLLFRWRGPRRINKRSATMSTKFKTCAPSVWMKKLDASEAIPSLRCVRTRHHI